MLSTESKLELVQRAVAGDEVALKLLLTDSFDRLCGHLGRRIPNVLLGKVGPEDLAQQTHVEVFRRIRAFVPRGPGSFDRWVLTIAINQLRNAIRRQKAQRRGGRMSQPVPARTVEDSTIALLDLIAGPSRTPSGSAARTELVEAVQTAIASLPEHYRKALWMVHIEGRPVCDAAAALERTERAVHGLCRRGMVLLRARLKSASRF